MSSPTADSVEPPAAAGEKAAAGQTVTAGGVITTSGSDLPAPVSPSQTIPRQVPPEALPAALAVALIVLGGALLAANLGLLAPEAVRAVQVTWPAALIFAGLGLIVAGQRLWKVESTPFTVERGEAKQADMVISAGTADVALGPLPEGGGLATGEWTARQEPQVTVQERRTTIRLEPPWGLPALGGARWRIELAAGTGWQLMARTSTGNLSLDLADLRPSDVRLRSVFGDIDLILPADGGADVDIALAFGDLTVHVPDGLGLKVKLRQGPLAGVEHDERRFIRLSPNEVGTPLYAVAAKRCTLTVWLGTGDLKLL